MKLEMHTETGSTSSQNRGQKEIRKPYNWTCVDSDSLYFSCIFKGQSICKGTKMNACFILFLFV